MRWPDMLDEFIDELRCPFVLVYMSVLLSWCVVNSTQIGSSVELEFKAYRLQQYDVLGTPHGSRSFKVMYEAVSLDSNVLRRCILLNWQELLGRDLQSLFGQGVGVLLIMMPSDLDALQLPERNKLANLERNLLMLNTDMSVYVAFQNTELQALLADVKATSKRSRTAFQQLLSAVSANTFQFSSSATVSNNIVTPKSFNIVGHLRSSDPNTPTVLLVAHYDTHAAVPALAAGADSNGSGVAALLELLAIFARFYASKTMKPKFNVVFLFTAGGKFSFQGSRQWLDEHVNKKLESDIELVVCLDSLGKGDTLYAHVSKVPSGSTPLARFMSLLKNALTPNRTMEVVSKKINLNADLLAWEHERYSMKRLPALTLSHHKTHTDLSRTSILDIPSQLDYDAFKDNIHTIGEAVLAYVLDLPSSKCNAASNSAACSILNGSGVQLKRLRNWITQFGSKPRPLAGDSEWVVANLRDTVMRYTYGQTTVEPVTLTDILLYGVLEDRLTAHRAKPAIFELLLGIVIGVYLSSIYYIALNLQPCVETALFKLKKL